MDTGYIEMFFVNLGDFFGLDWVFREKVKNRGIMIPGQKSARRGTRRNGC